MALDWLPIYPDQIAVDTDLPAAYLPFYAGAAVPPWKTWLPRFPDWILRRHSRPLGGITSDPFPHPTQGLPEFPTVTYPDQILRPSIRPDYRLWTAFFPNIPSTLKDFVAVYPDILRRKRTVTPHLPEAFVVLTSAFALPSPLTWQGSQPAQIARRTVHASRQQATALDASRTFAVTSTGWTPVYPDQIPPLRSVLAASQQVVAQNVDPIKNPPPTNSTWPPTYPSFVWSRVSLGASRQPSFGINLSPIPNAPAPDQSWQQAIPTPPIARVRLAPLPQRTTSLEPTLTVTQAWRGTYPSQIPSHVVPQLSGVVGWQAGWITAVAFFQWKAVYPNFLTRAVPTIPGGAPWRVDPTIILDTIPCVEWVDADLIRPQMIAEGLIRSSLTLAGQSLGYILTEEGGAILAEDGSLILLEDQGGTDEEQLIRPRMLEEDLC